VKRGDDQFRTLRYLLLICASVLILRVTASVVLSYRGYLPPDFTTDFLRGREAYFFGGYQWAFYVHIASGPVSLVLGMVLLSDRFRRKWPRWHRVLGRIQVANVLGLVTPSGLWMAFYAESGWVAELGFAALAIATGFSIAMGWLAAVKRRFASHQRWMWRCYVLLCSAVVLRVIGGLATVAGYYGEWLYPLNAWACWVVPLAALEATWIIGKQKFSPPSGVNDSRGAG